MIALCAVLCGGQGAVDMARFAREKEGFLRQRGAWIGWLVLSSWAE